MVNSIYKISSGFGKRLFSFILGISILCPNCAVIKAKNKNKADLSIRVSESESKKNKRKKAAIGSSVAVGVAALAFLGLRVIANSSVFPGIYMDKKTLPDIYDDQNVPLGNNLFADRKFIQIGDLKGCSFKCTNPSSSALKDKCVIVCGPNCGSVVDLAHSNAVKTLLDEGASVIAIDYRGFGHSKLKLAALRISQSTLYKDAEKFYEHALGLGFAPKDIIAFGYSLGGAGASHIADYAASKGQALGGIILASPIPGLIKAGNFATIPPLGVIARGVTFSKLDPAHNLQKVDKNIPIFLVSGDDNDWLGFNKTHLPDKISDCGFTNLTSYTESNCCHTQLNKMFGIEHFENREQSVLWKFIHNQVRM